MFAMGLNEAMRGGVVIVLLGLTALVSYSLGRQDAPTGKHSPAVVIQAPATPSMPVALAAVPSVAAAPVAVQSEPEVKTEQRPTKSSTPDKPTETVKRKAEIALTTAAIVAILIKASRDRYYATGHPCACPDDLMRNGRACGARSAHSRPGGASPLCFPSDVTEAMVQQYRATASR